MQALIFTAESSYARFRCPHTTTSALTFSTIHPIAAKGLIGAVLGIEYNELYDYTKDMKIGIQILKPVYKDTQSFNLIAQTNNNKAANFQSRIQFLRDVKYRIFVSDKDEKLERLKSVLKSHEYVFTPYLGCSEYIAKLQYEGTFPISKTNGQAVDTIVPKEYGKLNFVDDAVFYFDRIPVKNNKDREYVSYSRIVFCVGAQIEVNKCEIFKVGERNVFFF